jgi:uncharacterized damage-inducible protein DinB
MKRSEFIEYLKSVSNPMEALMEMSPTDKLGWRPLEGAWSLGQLLNHSSSSSAIYMALINNQWPKPETRIPHDQLPEIEGAKAKEIFHAHLENTLKLLESISDDDFNNKTVETPWGVKGSLARVIQVIADHQNSHRVELFMYLKLIGLKVNTQTLHSSKPSNQK